MRGIYLFRKDFRFTDNPALSWACQNCSEIKFFCWMDESFTRAGSLRRAWIQAHWQGLQRRLKEKGHSLYFLESPFRPSPSTDAQTHRLQELLTQEPVDVFISTREVGSEETSLEQKLQEMLTKLGVSARWFDQSGLFQEDDLSQALDKTPKSFTQFRKQVESKLEAEKPLPPPENYPQPIHWGNVAQDSLDFDLPEQASIEPQAFVIQENKIYAGEKASLRHLHRYIWEDHSILSYKETRNGLIEFTDSSKLSLWLALGAISARQIREQILIFEKEVAKNESTYWLYFELLWREFFRWECRTKKNRFFGERSGPESSKVDPVTMDVFRKWTEGQTGQRFIDANMLELASTGWMSNRGRQNVASFLAKTLGIPWQWGASYFESQLLDYDVSSNWGNWLYLSGQGSDPRDRQFNPERQAQMYDPESSYQRKWAPSKEPAPS